MKTLMGNDVMPETLGIVYFCEYDANKEVLSVIKEKQFISPFSALDAFANTYCPASQIASGTNRIGFLKELKELHHKMFDNEWLRGLKEVL